MKKLTELVKEKPDTKELDLSNQGLTSLKPILEHLLEFTNLEELNLEDNNIQSLEGLDSHAPRLRNLNLNGNDLDPFEKAIDNIQALPIQCLALNLVEEDQVDYVMRALQSLEELNGLPVERDLVEEEDEQEEEEFKELGEIAEAGKESSKDGDSPKPQYRHDETEIVIAQDKSKIVDVSDVVIGEDPTASAE